MAAILAAHMYRSKPSLRRASPKAYAMHKTDPDSGSSSSLHSRRHLLASIAATGIASASGCSTPQLLRHAATAQTSWIPEPPQPPTKEDFADLGDVRLWYSDTGGTGEPVVVLHPMTGSDAIWSYQRPAFVDAGFRFIAYSRRGHGKSEPGPPNDPGYGARDLEALTRLLGLKRFHLLGTAAGGFLAPDFALSYPDRLLSLVIACSLGGITDSQYRATTARITGPDFYRMPSSFRELGPSYRAACPEGVRRWEELEHARSPRCPRCSPCSPRRTRWSPSSPAPTPGPGAAAPSRPRR